jgi:hypothetical protein
VLVKAALAALIVAAARALAWALHWDFDEWADLSDD